MRSALWTFGVVSFVALMLWTSLVGAGFEETVEVGVGIAPAGYESSFPVYYYTDDIAYTAAVQLDIGFQPETPVVVRMDGKPDCSVSSAADASFGFLPPGCSGGSCTGVRAIVVSVDDITVLETDSVIFTCKVKPPAGTPPAYYSLAVLGALGSDVQGNQIPMTTNDGWVEVPDTSGC